ncbi:MAG TPA: cysteine dioxygenase family protein [Streptosporangiaceae bacterium]|nr:cysteine dioxygenase family protein [Streptosporangiaceae bacterium]
MLTQTMIDPALVTGVRAAVDRHEPWRETATRVAEVLAANLPTPDVFTADQRLGDPSGYSSHLLHVEPDGAFSVLGIVWRPGHVTPIHDHVTWCAFGVVQGAEYEELYTLSDDGTGLVRAGENINRVGEVSGFAPPGDIHRVRNAGTEVAMSIHIYGTDISRIGSSVRRCYDLPVRDR